MYILSGSTFTIETGVDKLVRFLKGKGNVPVKEVAEEIGVTIKTIEQWATFLMEEKIVGIDYKFTTPYIYLIEEKGKEPEYNNLNEYKKQFSQIKKGNLSDQHIEYHWNNHLMDILDSKRDFFYREAMKRGLKNIDQLWNEYKAKVTNL